MKSSQEQSDVALALGAAFEPLIDVCLQLGITSPELETLLRATFVQRAVVRLPRHPRTKRIPSDSRVSAAIGVHRNEVARLRAAGAAAGARSTMEKKQQLYSKSARILHGWTTDPKFLTSGGLPLDLPLERNRQKKSFEDLVDKYAPGNHPGTVLKELRRRQCVDLIEGDVVRFKSQTPRAEGMTKANVARAARRMKQLGTTVFHNIASPDRPRLYAEIEPVSLSAEQLALIIAILERRTKSFLDSIDSEIKTRSPSILHEETKLIGVGVYSWQEE